MSTTEIPQPPFNVGTQPSTSAARAAAENSNDASDNGTTLFNVFYDPSLATHLSKGWQLSQLLQGRVATLTANRFVVSIPPMAAATFSPAKSEAPEGSSTAAEANAASMLLASGHTAAAAAPARPDTLRGIFYDSAGAKASRYSPV